LVIHELHWTEIYLWLHIKAIIYFYFLNNFCAMAFFERTLRIAETMKRGLSFRKMELLNANHYKDDRHPDHFHDNSVCTTYSTKRSFKNKFRY